METLKSVEIIQNMIKESRRSLYRNSFHFLLWGALLIPAGIAEFMLSGNINAWMVWPIMGISGGIVSAIYGKREGERAGVETTGDRITAYTWGGFIGVLVFAIAYTVSNHLNPHALILILSALATFISGGISQFKPFVWGAVALALGAILTGFVIEPHYHSLVFSASIFFGYVIPGILLRKQENV